MNKFQLRYCKKCLVPNTRPNGRFSEHGMCAACEFIIESRNVDYEYRFHELEGIVRNRTKYRRNRRWNCVVGVSGGKDSTRQALWVRDKLQMRPLLVCVSYPPRQVSSIGTANLSNLISLGFDCVVLAPAPKLSRRLVRRAFFEFGNWCKATEMALFAGVPQVALQKGIDLILWGENPALQVGDQGTLGADIWDGDKLRNSNTLQGGELSWFLDEAKDESLLAMYKFPNEIDLQKHGVRTIFLGPAWPDWSNTTNAAVSLTHGFRLRTQDWRETGDLYRSEMIDEEWVIVNNLLKYYKLGFSRGTEQANSMIRSGLISREEGMEIAKVLDPACGEEYILSFCKYLEISITEFWDVVRRFAHPLLFDNSVSVRPIARFTPGIDTDLNERNSL